VPDDPIVVVGAGFAGLSAASMIAAHGRRVLVLEARPTIGGRATAFTDPATGERVDNGQHVLIGCYHETFRFLRLIGADANVSVQSDLSVDVIDREGRASRLACPRLPPPMHLLAGVLTWSALTWRDCVAVLRVGIALRGPRAGRTVNVRPYEDKPALTVREWLIAHGQTPRLIELLWEPLAVAALNQPIDVAAADPFLVVLRRMFTGTRRDAALALPVAPLDGMYALPAKRFIEQHNGEVRVSSPVTIRFDDRGPQGSAPQLHDLGRGSSGPAPQLRDLRRGPSWSAVVGGQAVPSAAIVVAVPWHALDDTLIDPPAGLRTTIDHANATAASPIVTVNLWFDRAVTDRTFVGLPGRTMQWVFDKRLLFGEAASHLSLVSSGAEAVVARSNQELTELALSEVREALPAARDARLERAVVVREKRATFSVAPGQPPRPSTITAVPGLFLAGDWIDTGLPATIESAVLSGHMAAEAALTFVNGDL